MSRIILAPFLLIIVSSAIALAVAVAIAVVRSEKRAVWWWVLGGLGGVLLAMMAPLALYSLSYSRTVTTAPPMPRAETNVEVGEQVEHYVRQGERPASSLTAESSTAPPASRAGAATDDPTDIATEARPGSSPGQGPIYPSNRPEWVERPGPRFAGADRFTVSSDPLTTRSEALRQLDHRLAEAIGEYAAEIKGDEAAGELVAGEPRSWKPLLALDGSAVAVEPLSSEHGRQEGNLYLEKVTFPEPLGEMYQAHAKVELNEPFHQFVDTRWRAAQARQRLVVVGLSVVGVMFVLLLLSVVLHISPRLSSSRRRRLQSSAAAAILCGAAVSHWLGA